MTRHTLLASLLLLSFSVLGGCGEEQGNDEFTSDTADQGSGQLGSRIDVVYDFAYVDLMVEGKPGTISFSDGRVESDCSSSLLDGNAGEALSGLAWGGVHRLVTSSSTTQVSFSQRAIPGCGDDAGEPTEADLEACQSVKALLAAADERAIACVSA